MSEETERTNAENVEELNEQIKIRREKLKELQSKGQNPFDIKKYSASHKSLEILDKFEELDEQSVSIAGRIMTKRIMGKASFVHIQDKDGRIQAYVRQDELGDAAYEDFVKLDIGDIIGIEGSVFKTQKGEISVKAANVSLLSKSLQVFPEKFHGLKDQDLKYRRRYLDLIVNPEVRDVFQKRSKIIQSIRRTLDAKGFLEVETPILQPIHGGANARPFKTQHNTLNMSLYLRIALELYLKRLIVGGFEKVYEIGRIFRNEGMSVRHNPEFTMLELYEAYADYNDIMDLCEEVLKTACLDVLGTTEAVFDGVLIDYGKPFERITMTDAVKKYASVDFDEILTLDDCRKTAEKHGIKYKNSDVRGNFISLFFEEFAEEKLIQPTFVTAHPVEISPFAKKMQDDESLTERFELFVSGRELANAFSELNDPIDQRERFEYQESLRQSGDEEAHVIDEDFLLSMEYGMPPTGGIGIGIDRLVQLLTDCYAIRDVLLFPTMRPL